MKRYASIELLFKYFVKLTKSVHISLLKFQSMRKFHYPIFANVPTGFTEPI